MQTKLYTRRAITAILASLFLTGPALALTKFEAESLIDKLTSDIFLVINSGKTEKIMLRDFERIFAKYADVPVIARSSLGFARRGASKSQIKSYTKVFQGYMARKYGKRFREFIGADIKVIKSHKSKRGFLVDSTVTFKGKRPFLVQWQVSDASGRNLMFDIIIEGISMLRLEREEVGAMLDRRGGNINKLIAHLKTMS